VKNKELESESRREAMCAGGAGMMAAMFGGLLGVANGVRAEPVKGAVPVVDKLAVRVVTDSYQLALAPSTSICRRQGRALLLPGDGEIGRAHV
jgi:7,8-dihydropterin-6-yl-methyl-4-(beta-D-ribofuranosyl)aminobenzene 5'-phosphate synthase